MTDARRTQLYSASLTAVLWILAAIIVFTVPLAVPKDKKEFPVVRISLSQNPRAQNPAESAPSPAVQQTLPEATSPRAENAPSVPSSPSAQAAQAAQSRPAAVPPPKAAVTPPAAKPASSAPKAAAEPAVQSAPQTLAPDLTTIDIGHTTADRQPQRKEVEWPSEVEWVTQSTKQAKDSAAVSGAPAAGPAVKESPSQFEGTAAQLAQAADTGARAASTGRDAAAAPKASEQTTGALKRISEATYARPGGTPGVSHETALAVAQGSGGVEIQMKDGSTRRLLDPAEPSITLSPASELLIDSSRRVLIQFRVLASGNVPAGNISFSPASLLPVPVQEEIRAQIARWRFETAQGDGQAAFQYSIKKQ